MLQKTSLGLKVRAVAQNRNMAKAMGVRTQWVDAMTFGLGSGIAGSRASRCSQLTNVGPNLGQQYIIDSFMVVVFGGVGNLWGTLIGGMSLGVVSKVLEPCAGAVLAKILVLICADPLHPAAAARVVPAEGPGGGELSMRRTGPLLSLLVGERGTAVFLVDRRAGRRRRAGVAPGCLPEGSALQLSGYTMTLIGKYMTATRCSRWPWIWSGATAASCASGHGAFFALGGYAMGMYLMRQIGTRGVYGDPVLPDFMVFLNCKELPWFWHGFDMFWFAMLMVVLVPGLLALVFGWLAFRSRVTGVYLSIITQALTYALMLAFFRNDMGFGGNNGMTDFKEHPGLRPSMRPRRAWRCSWPARWR